MLALFVYEHFISHGHHLTPLMVPLKPQTTIAVKVSTVNNVHQYGDEHEIFQKHGN
jgi:hypothetical protein